MPEFVDFRRELTQDFPLRTGSDAYVERPDRQGLSRTLNLRRTALSYVRPCFAGARWP